jgi:chromosome segregation ATPase
MPASPSSVTRSSSKAVPSPEGAGAGEQVAALRAALQSQEREVAAMAAEQAEVKAALVAARQEAAAYRAKWAATAGGVPADDSDAEVRASRLQRQLAESQEGAAELAAEVAELQGQLMEARR